MLRSLNTVVILLNFNIIIILNITSFITEMINMSKLNNLLLQYTSYAWKMKRFRMRNKQILFIHSLIVVLDLLMHSFSYSWLIVSAKNYGLPFGFCIFQSFQSKYLQFFTFLCSIMIHINEFLLRYPGPFSKSQSRVTLKPTVDELLQSKYTSKNKYINKINNTFR